MNHTPVSQQVQACSTGEAIVEFLTRSGTNLNDGLSLLEADRAAYREVFKMEPPVETKQEPLL